MKINNIDEVFQNYISRSPDYSIDEFMLLLELEYEEIKKEDYESLKAKFGEYIANRDTKKAGEAEVNNSKVSEEANKKKRVRCNYKYFVEIRKDNPADDITPENRYIDRVTKVPKSLFQYLYRLMQTGSFIDKCAKKKPNPQMWARNRLIIDKKNHTKTLIFDSYDDVQGSLISRKYELYCYIMDTVRLLNISRHEFDFLSNIIKPSKSPSSQN